MQGSQKGARGEGRALKARKYEGVGLEFLEGERGEGMKDLSLSKNTGGLALVVRGLGYGVGVGY